MVSLCGRLAKLNPRRGFGNSDSCTRCESRTKGAWSPRSKPSYVHVRCHASNEHACASAVPSSRSQSRTCTRTRVLAALGSFAPARRLRTSPQAHVQVVRPRLRHCTELRAYSRPRLRQIAVAGSRKHK